MTTVPRRSLFSAIGAIPLLFGTCARAGAGREDAGNTKLVFDDANAQAGVAREDARRVALVVGNANYNGGLRRLESPMSDSHAIATALTECGFDVTRKRDLDRQQFRATLRDFAQVSEQSGFSVLYFGGSGFMKGGVSYVTPVDGEDHSPAFAIGLAELLAAVSQAKIKLIILDACQDSIVPSEAETVRLPADLPAGAMIVYSAAPNSRAIDVLNSGDSNGPFAKALLERIQNPGLELRVLFDQVRDAVRMRTKGRQQPMIISTLPGARDFWLARR